MIRLSPIVLFTYNRPEHTQRCLSALKKAELSTQSDLIIYSDGAKNEYDESDVHQVRQLISKIDWCDFKLIRRNTNLGLANSIYNGLNEVFSEYEYAIVLEDDLIVHQYFLKFMNHLLPLMSTNKRIAQISGYRLNVYPNSNKTFLYTPLISTWGWGTTSHHWEQFKNFRENLDLNQFNSWGYFKKRRFNGYGIFNYYNLLKRTVVDFRTWGVLFYLYAFTNSFLNIVPSNSLIENIGFDSKATNTTGENRFKTLTQETEIHFELNRLRFDKRLTLWNYLEAELNVMCANIR